MIFSSWDSDLEENPPTEGRLAGRYISRGHVPAHLLNNGDFLLGVNAGIFNVQSFITEEACLIIRVDATDAVGGHWAEEERGGYSSPSLEWTLRKID